jgi:hypothetical protein
MAPAIHGPMTPLTLPAAGEYLAGVKSVASSLAQNLGGP